jgi:hypothetical protein
MNADRTKWEEWHHECDLIKCSHETQTSLIEQVDRVFSWYVRILDPELELKHQRDELPYSWTFFEEKMRAGTTRDGKRYKDALLMCGISQTVKLRCRDLARELVGFTRKKVVQGAVSMETSISENEDGPVTLHDLLSLSVDPSQEAYFRMLAADAERFGRLVFDSLSLREKLALLVRALDLNPSDESVEVTVGCKKTMLYAACSAIRERMERVARSELSGEDEQIYELVATAGMHVLEELALNWGGSEKSAEPLFMLQANAMVE